ncbi:O-antigen ligase family protein [Clostridium intestinale]|uniref:O-antigen ligase family protein n=1 Tax=Clostridium intestinale TaxID=36845 RepID=UPI002DD64CE8|nr:O-antigen ligase family protein [Clostridium intestinale]WRY50010.1 O-antigen ligase family protein [Clostridium intestinale]
MFKKEITLILAIIAGAMPLIMHPFSDDSYYLPKTIFLYIMYFLLIFILLRDRKNISLDKNDRVLIIYLGIALLSTIFSIKPMVSIFGTEIRYEGVIMLLFYGLTYYCGKNYLEINKKVILAVLVPAVIISIYSIFQFYNIDPIPKDSYHARMLFNSIGTQGHRNFLSAYISLFLPCTIVLYILKGKKVYIGVAAVLFASLLCTLTRSGWIAFIAYSLLGAVYIIINFNKKYLTRALILMIAFISIFGILDYTSGEKISSRSDQLIYDTKSASGDLLKNGKITNEALGSARVYIWKVALKAIEKNPLIGSGTDTFRYSIEKYFPEDGQDYIDAYGAIIDKAHNEFLQIAATMGIPALIAYLVFIFLSLKNNIKNMWKSKINFIISITFIGYLIQSFFNISVINVAPLFWMGLGLAQNSKVLEKAENYIESKEGQYEEVC